MKERLMMIQELTELITFFQNIKGNQNVKPIVLKLQSLLQEHKSCIHSKDSVELERNIQRIKETLSFVKLQSRNVSSKMYENKINNMLETLQ